MIELLEDSPVIAAVKNEEGLREALLSECRVVFVLYGTVCDIQGIVEKLKEKGKAAMVHVDLIAGLSAREVAVDYIKNNTRADGIISTKAPLVKHAKDIGLFGIQRTFVVDSIALSTLKKQMDSYRPDAVEIMPGIMPGILREMKAHTNIPLIAGGLLADKKDVVAALEAGADAISTTKKELWYI